MFTKNYISSTVSTKPDIPDAQIEDHCIKIVDDKNYHHIVGNREGLLSFKDEKPHFLTP